MGEDYFPDIIEDTFDNRIVNFDDGTAWRLKRQLAEKGRWGSDPYEIEEFPEEWDPCEAHTVYECVQLKGPCPGMEAIIKIRIEVPYELPPSDDPQVRAKDASGMRLASSTKTEIYTLKKLTAAGCSVTPRLLATKIDVQDRSILHKKTSDHERRWWMPGGYIAYILMEKLPAQVLEYSSFWNDFTEKDREEVRRAFKKAYMELRAAGIRPRDEKIDNLMWDPKKRKCFIIDMEDTADSSVSGTGAWNEFKYCSWNLAMPDGVGVDKQRRIQ